ncbi:MAG: hypothetical protein ACWGO1_06615, partial [Anaerolineales bacterium]
ARVARVLDLLGEIERPRDDLLVITECIGVSDAAYEGIHAAIDVAQGLPIGIFLPREQVPTITSALILGQPLPSLAPLLWSAGLSVVFVLIGLWRFERTEL